MLASRQGEVSSLRARYMGGLEKLATTAASVEQMQADLVALQPQLEEAKACNLKTLGSESLHDWLWCRLMGLAHCR